MAVSRSIGSTESAQALAGAASQPGLLTPLTPAGFSCDDASCAF